MVSRSSHRLPANRLFWCAPEPDGAPDNVCSAAWITWVLAKLAEGAGHTYSRPRSSVGGEDSWRIVTDLESAHVATRPLDVVRFPHAEDGFHTGG
jgi:hypothetical protein